LPEKERDFVWQPKMFSPNQQPKLQKIPNVIWLKKEILILIYIFSRLENHFIVSPAQPTSNDASCGIK
jgi:hypothetical protein